MFPFKFISRKRILRFNPSGTPITDTNFRRFALDLSKAVDKTHSLNKAVEMPLRKKYNLSADEYLRAVSDLILYNK